MINEELTFGRYEIVSIGLDLSRDLLFDFMTLQLAFLLDVCSNKYITFEIMALLIGKKPFKLSKKLKRKPCI